MSTLLHTVAIDDAPYEIYESLQVGETITSDDETYTVPDKKALFALKSGKAPVKPKAPAKAPVKAKSE